MFMTRRRVILTPALPPGPHLKICLTPGSALSAVRAKICLGVSNLLTHHGKDNSNVRWCLGDR